MKSLENIIPFVIDNDHVLSNGVYYPSMGRKYNLRDGLGISLLVERTNIEPIIMSGERDESIYSRAKKLNIAFFPTKNKFKTLTRWYHGLKYLAISDDTPDLELLQNATVAFCPADAHDEVLRLVDRHGSGIILTRKGGDACVREAIDYLLSNKYLQEKFNIKVVQQKEQHS